MERLLTVKEAAERTGLSQATWRGWILLRQVRFVKLGRAVRIDPKEIERLVLAGTVDSHMSYGRRG